MADEEARRLLLRRFGCRLSGMSRDQACAREHRRPFLTLTAIAVSAFIFMLLAMPETVAA
jgi:hypothetical protein